MRQKQPGLYPIFYGIRSVIVTIMKTIIMRSLGIFVGRGYSVESNKEKGLGRPDIVLKDKRNRRAVIIEAKKSEKESDMDKDCDKAIGQITTEKYAEGLYGYTQVLCYGIAFFQKQAKVKGINIR